MASNRSFGGAMLSRAFGDGDDSNPDMEMGAVDGLRANFCDGEKPPAVTFENASGSDVGRKSSAQRVEAEIRSGDWPFCGSPNQDQALSQPFN
jgi:hypothetical protein